MASQPVILLGAQRSGTTAVATVLNLAFDAAGGIFTINGKLPYLLHRWCGPADLAGRHLRADEIMYALRRRPPYGRNAERWLSRVEGVLADAAARVAAGEVRDAVELRGEIVRAAYADGTRLGEKYNEYLLELDELALTLPDARWVLLVRHPAAVAASTLAWAGARPWRPADTAAALAKWSAWHAPALAHPWLTQPGRCVVLEYQQVCAGPGLARLGEVVGLDLSPYAHLLTARPEPRPVDLPPGVAEVWRRLREHGA